MKKYMIFLLSLGILFCCSPPSERVAGITQDYIEQWKSFYPSLSFSAGDLESALAFEDFSLEKVNSWIDYNQKVLDRLESLPERKSLDERIDLDLLERQVQGELERWEKDRDFEDSPLFYAERISQALTHILARDDLSQDVKLKAIDNRLAGIKTICTQGQRFLKNGRPHNTEGAISVLESSARFYGEGLPRIVLEWSEESGQDSWVERCRDTAASIRLLADHIRENIVPSMSLSDSMGQEDYARKLKIFTGTDITLGDLERIAYQEVQEVRHLMEETSAEYWRERYTGEEVPGGFSELVGRAIRDMEENRENNQQDFLDYFIDLVDRAENFIREKNIVTLPAKRTLTTALSPPHFAGAAVGGVYPAGPFNPDAQTLFYLPTVPDDSPDSVKEGFYRSFNNHFNTMIITHEIYPGHYLQLKMAASNPHLVRSLFADGLYAEGWATLCEVLTLDAGWNGFDKLDRLAHLRKRLENATRAYASVQVHCKGWDRERVHDFAVKEGLLAPQFALNLWDRVTASPLQLVSYFLGFKMFSEVLEKEKERLGDDFALRTFCDSVLQAGAVSIEYLPSLLVGNNERSSSAHE
jgi:uncharacterized protein (DUF885 family)